MVTFSPDDLKKSPEYSAEILGVVRDNDTVYAAFHDTGTGLNVNSILHAIVVHKDVKKLVLIPVENDCSIEEYNAIAYHYMQHPEEVEQIKKENPVIDAVAVRWIPFAKEKDKSGFLGETSKLHLKVPEAMRNHIRTRMASRGGIPETQVYVSEQIVSGNDMMTSDTVKSDMIQRAVEFLLHGTRFKKSVYDEQTVYGDRLFLQLYYITTAVHIKLSPVMDVEDFANCIEGCFYGLMTVELMEEFKTIAEDAKPYLEDAKSWNVAARDFSRHIELVQKTIANAEKRIRKENRHKKLRNFFASKPAAENCSKN